MRLPNQRFRALPKRVNRPGIWRVYGLLSLSLVFLAGCAGGTSAMSASCEFFWRRLSHADSDGQPNSDCDARFHAQSGSIRNDGTSRQENRQTGARGLGECGCGVERGRQRLCRSSASLKAGGDRVEESRECCQSDRRIRPDKRRRKPGEQSGHDCGRDAQGPGQNASPFSGGGRSNCRISCANDSDS